MFPSDTPSVFFGTPTDDFAAHTHPPVGEYYLAIVDLLLGGAGEIPLRVSFSIFSMMAAIGFYALARRFTESPIGVTLLLVVSPAFFVMSHTIMMDMPMLAFLLVGVALYLHHLDGRPNRLWIAALCFILAVGTGYTALVPVGCVFVWAVYRKRPIRELAAIAAAPAVLFVWLMAMTAHFGRFPLLDTVGFFFDQPRSTFQNLLATFSFLGGVGLFPWTFLYLIRTRDKQIYRVSLAAVGIAILATLPLEWSSLTQRLLFIGLTSSGIAMTATALTWLRTSSGLAPILLWVPTVLTLFIVVGDTIQARYLLPAPSGSLPGSVPQHAGPTTDARPHPYAHAVRRGRSGGLSFRQLLQELGRRHAVTGTGTGVSRLGRLRIRFAVLPGTERRGDAGQPRPESRGG